VGVKLAPLVMAYPLSRTHSWWVIAELNQKAIYDLFPYEQKAKRER
jgi:hypothetical protein